MARVLVRLKIALLRAGLRTAGVQGRLGAAFAFLIAVGVGSGGAALLALARLLGPTDAADVTSGALGVVLVVWVLGPIIAAGTDGTLEPDRLAPFPLTRGQLMPGLLLAALVGFGGLVTVLLLVGAVAGTAPASPLAVVTLAGAAAHLLLCAGVSRLVGTVISGAAQRRRWRDVALFAGPLVALVLNVGLQLLSRSLTGDITAHRTTSLGAVRGVARVAGGPAALAVGLAGEGRALESLAALAVAALLVVLVVIGWAAAFERALTSGAASGVRPGKTRLLGRPSSAPRPLRPRLLPFLPSGRLGAVAAKDLRLTWRDPRQRVAMLGAMFGASVPLFSLRILSSTSPRVVLAAAFPAFVLGTQSTNQFGFDGPAHWLSVATGDDPRPELVGKTLARLVLAVAPVTVGLVVLSLRAGTWQWAIPTVGLAAAAFGVACGMGNWFSVVSAVPLPDTITNVFSSGSTGRSLAAAGPALAVLFGGGLLLSPLLVALLVVDDVLVRDVIGLVGFGIGVGAWAAGTGLATRHLRTRQPELLADLSAGA